MTRHIGFCKNFSYAFTLAEVLITLGIIGVVASITMPTLIQSHRRQVTEAKLKKFYSVINQAVTASEIDNSDKETWLWQKDSDQYGTENFYNTYLKNYIEPINTQKVSQNEISVVLKDGTAMRLKASEQNGGYIYFCTEASACKAEHIDYKLYGKKVFTFGFWPGVANNSNYKHHYQRGVEPYRVFYKGFAEDQKYTAGSDTHLNCNPKTTGEKWYCTTIIQENGWKIPKDYPFIL